MPNALGRRGFLSLTSFFFDDPRDRSPRAWGLAELWGIVGVQSLDLDPLGSAPIYVPLNGIGRVRLLAE
eukprot:scaffold9473_cov164-Isochrysis_galbana.AAC.2